MTQALRLVVMFVVAMVVQWYWSTHGTIAGLAPQLLLVLTVMVAARYGALRAMILGFLWGLFLDVMSARLVGANAFALTLAAYGTGSVRRQVDLFGLGPQCLMVIAVTVVYFLLLGLLGALFLKTFIWVGWTPFLVDPLYNCFVTVLCFGLWESLMERHR